MRQYRNIGIFTLLVCLAGWVGLLMEQWLGGEGQSGLGILLWLVSPLASCLLLRAFGGDGWSDLGLRPALGRNLSWYFFSLLIYPMGATLVLIVDMAFGSIHVLSAPGHTPAVFFQMAALAFMPLFFKNIFEEFGWRGYLTPRLAALHMNDYAADLLTGLIWATWHLPYYFGLLSREELRSYTSQGMVTFILAMYLGLVASSLVYGEIRRQSATVWPAVVMHTSGNAFLTALLVQGFVSINPHTQFIFTPSLEGLLSAAIYALAGIVLHEWGKRQLSAHMPAN